MNEASPGQLRNAARAHDSEADFAQYGPEPSFPAGTMDAAYGDGSDHVCCPSCGLCVTCGDCADQGCSAGV